MKVQHFLNDVKLKVIIIRIKIKNRRKSFHPCSPCKDSQENRKPAFNKETGVVAYSNSSSSSSSSSRWLEVVGVAGSESRESVATATI